MKKVLCIFVCFALALTSLVSCAGRVESENGGDTKKENLSAVSPADYHEGDLTYTLSISDGYRTVSMEVKREGAVTTANLVKPSELTGVSVIYDAAGMRMNAPEGEEIAITEEGSLGLAVFFDSMAHELTQSEKRAEGEYVFVSDGYDVRLVLDKEGYPCLIEAVCGVSKRCAEVTVAEADLDEAP